MLFVHACLPALLEKKRQPNWNLLWRFSCQNWMLCCKSHLRCVSLFLRKVRDDMTIEDIMKAKWLVPPPTVGTGPSSWGILAGSPPGWGRMLPAGCLECWGSHETHSPCCGNTHASRQPLWFCWRHWQLEGKYDVIYIVTPQRTTHKAVPTSFECVLLEFEKKNADFLLGDRKGFGGFVYIVLGFQMNQFELRWCHCICLVPTKVYVFSLPGETPSTFGTIVSSYNGRG